MKLLEFDNQAITAELNNIGQWWLKNTLDDKHGGFVGEIDFTGNVVEGATKGIVQNSRILWFYSEKALFSDKPEYEEAATRAFDYLLTYFDDVELGGAIWEVSASGEPINGKKQTYAQSFCIYAFCAYYKLTGNKVALTKAMQYFELVEEHARDRKFGGYIEAYTQDWQVIDDLRLSEKDLNAPKSMNTHLHVLEAYSALYAVAPDEVVKEALEHVIDVFNEFIIDKEIKHLRLFFDKQWNDMSETISYGHDIEASWLLWEAVEILNDKDKIAYFKPIIIDLAAACLDQAIGKHGQVCDEYELADNIRHEESHWWVQAEALVGFLNAYYLTGESQYLDACNKIWLFIQRYHIDHFAGEWHWMSSADNNERTAIYKTGFWKAPYHNGRAMMEVVKLFNLIEVNISETALQNTKLSCKG
ncbi:AGE family epimerase/isomerase [Colwellia sp. E2M01]|uniref:AGE family epimerase/isomerase n=1 Tax=Colwellia sp. E2M01 TaxID=2841561 RepID=UPI002091DF93|nr:AGE family epimerase/isomerase [Colwellia sp. E2M01]